MKKFIVVALVALACVFGYFHFAKADEVLLKKADYVSVIIDQSGSMYMKDKCHKETKMAIAKKAVANVVKNVPSLGYDTRLSLASKDVELVNAKFDKEVVLSMVEKVKDEGKFYGNYTKRVTALSRECVVDVSAR